jgi:hypothetical protein
MTMGILTKLIEKPDLYRYKPEFYPDGTEKHIFCDGARFHVLSYSSTGVRCSEGKCEYNLPDDKRIALIVDEAAARADAARGVMVDRHETFRTGEKAGK